MPGIAATTVPSFVPPNEMTGAIQAATNAINTLNTASASPPSLTLNALASGSPAINPHVNAAYIVTKGSIAAMTLAAPTTVVDDGVTITVTSNTAFAHTITFASTVLQFGAGAATVVSFAAQAGASITFQAFGAKWNVVANNLCTAA